MSYVGWGVPRRCVPRMPKWRVSAQFSLQIGNHSIRIRLKVSPRYASRELHTCLVSRTTATFASSIPSVSTLPAEQRTLHKYTCARILGPFGLSSPAMSSAWHPSDKQHHVWSLRGRHCWHEHDLWVPLNTTNRAPYSPPSIVFLHSLSQALLGHSLQAA